MASGSGSPFPTGIEVHEPLVKDQISLSDDSETDLFDVGQLSSPTVQKVGSMYVELALGGHANVDFRLYVDINGSLENLGGVKNFNSSQPIDLSDAFDVGVPIASSRVRITAQGANASPAPAGTVDFTLEHQTAK